MTLADLHAIAAQAILNEAYWGDRTLTDPVWRTAWDAIPRHLFAPDRYYEWTGDAWAEHNRGDDPEAWARAVYNPDRPLITQIDDAGAPTCSLSAPKLVAAMLGALDLKPGLRVLESGAGCGWTASLMYQRLVPNGVVVSVEYDRQLAKQAQVDAFDAGALPVIRAGDGMLGAPDLAPFDRVAATHSVRRIPRAWIEQTKPGGLVCAPLAMADQGLDLYVRLTVAGDGSAQGRIVLPLAFMPSRTEVSYAAADLAGDEARPGETNLDVPQILADGLWWVLQVAVPGIKATGPCLEDGDDTVWVSVPDGSWAVAWTPQGAPWKGAAVEQHGPQDVWTLAERAWVRWEAAGRPELDEFGLTVAADGVHRLWMKLPDNVVTEF